MAPLHFKGQPVRLIRDGHVEGGTAGAVIRRPTREASFLPSAECMRAILGADLSAPEKSLLHSIAWAQAESPDGLARVSVTRLGEGAGQSPPRVQTHLKTLEASGIVEFVNRSHGGCVDGGAARTHVLRVSTERLLAQRKYPLPEPAIASADARKEIILRDTSPTPVQFSPDAEEPQSSPPTSPTQRCCECGRMAGDDDRQTSTPKSLDATPKFCETTPKSLGSTPNFSKSTPKFHSADSKAFESQLPNLTALTPNSFPSTKNKTSSSSSKPPGTLESQQTTRGGGVSLTIRTERQDPIALRLLLEYGVYDSVAGHLSRLWTGQEIRTAIAENNQNCGTARSKCAVLVGRLKSRVSRQSYDAKGLGSDARTERFAAKLVQQIVRRYTDSSDSQESEYASQVKKCFVVAWGDAEKFVAAGVVPIDRLLDERVDHWDRLQLMVAALPTLHRKSLYEALPASLRGLLPQDIGGHGGAVVHVDMGEGGSNL